MLHVLHVRPSCFRCGGVSFLFLFQISGLGTRDNGRRPKTRLVHASRQHARVRLQPRGRRQASDVSGRLLSRLGHGSRPARARRRLVNAAVGPFGQISVGTVTQFLLVRMGESTTNVLRFYFFIFFIPFKHRTRERGEYVTRTIRSTDRNKIVFFGIFRFVLGFTADRKLIRNAWPRYTS